MSVRDYMDVSIDVLQQCRDYPGLTRVDEAVGAIVSSLRAGNTMMVCGNGGSASDAMHITGELVGRFLKERRALKCICLSSNASVLTAWANDYSFDTVFARQVEAYGGTGSVLLGISTSGNSRNVVEAFKTAQQQGTLTIGLTGRSGGQLAQHCDILIDVPSQHTPHIQQAHICLYHYICASIESEMMLSGDKAKN